MVVNCIKCRKSVSRSQKGVCCTACQDPYHISCGGISAQLFKDIEQGMIEWRCPSCRSMHNSIINSGSPIISSDDMCGDSETAIVNTVSEIASEVKKELEKVQHSFISINHKISELQKLSATVSQHEKRIQYLEKENKSMKTIIKSLTLKSDVFEQGTCANKLQINAIPYTDGEDLLDVIRKIGNKLRITIVNSDISDIRRIKHKRQPRSQRPTNNDIAANNNESHASDPSGVLNSDGPIIVEFFSKVIRNKIISTYRKNNKIFFDDNKQQKFFINEYLSSYNRQLFFKAKAFIKEHNFKYLWTRDGEILLKKTEGGKVIHINRFTDFTSMDNGMDSGKEQLD